MKSLTDLKEKRKDFHRIELNKMIILFCSDSLGEYAIRGYIDLIGTKRKFINLETRQADNDNWSQREGWNYL